MSDRGVQWKKAPSQEKPRQNAVDKYKQLKDSQKRGSLSWADCPAEDLLACVAAVVGDGAALLLSKTSDGGALVLRVITDAGSNPWYPASMASLNEALSEITEVAGKA